MRPLLLIPATLLTVSSLAACNSDETASDKNDIVIEVPGTQATEDPSSSTSLPSDKPELKVNEPLTIHTPGGGTAEVTLLKPLEFDNDPFWEPAPGMTRAVCTTLRIKNTYEARLDLIYVDENGEFVGASGKVYDFTRAPAPEGAVELLTLGEALEPGQSIEGCVPVELPDEAGVMNYDQFHIPIPAKD